MVTTIEHVRHRVSGTWIQLAHRGDLMLATTACGRRFLPSRPPSRDTRHHEPARRRCEVCW